MLYPIAIELGDEKHAFGVVVPDIPGCFSAGDTLEESLEMAKEAIHLHMGELARMEMSIPEAAAVDAYYSDPEYKGWIWAVVDVDITPYLGKSQKINVTLPDLLIKQIDDRVSESKTYKTRSGFLQQAALHELSR